MVSTQTIKILVVWTEAKRVTSHIGTNYFETNYSPDKKSKQRKHNTDGSVYSLRQPGLLRNRLQKSMRETSIRLLNFRCLDRFCYQDRVNRAAGQRAVGSVFCFPSIKCTLTSKLRSYYRDKYVIRLYLDETITGHLSGQAKNSPTPTRTATNQTAESLCFIAGLNILTSVNNILP
jgi:hypothetical protein